MARRNEPEKKQALARRAVEVLRERGLELSMTALAEALGVKRPTLLYHFPTRGDIIVTALEELLMDQARFVMARVATHDHPLDRLGARIRAIHAFHDGREARIVFLSQAVAAVSGERVQTLIDVGNRVFEAQRRAQAAGVRRGIEQGLITDCDVDSLMALVRAVTDGLLVTRVMTGLDLPPVHDFFEQMVLEPLRIPKSKSK